MRNSNSSISSIRSVSSISAIALASLLLVPSRADAGDPTAHTAATVRAARQVAAVPVFTQGVGAPLVGGVPVPGRFPIPLGSDTELACPYETAAQAVHGCSYSDLNGRAINEPDAWSCLSPFQSPVVSALNLRLAWGEAIVATVAAQFNDSAALACNYNHFTSNPALGDEYSAAFTAAANELDAARIPILIAGPIQTMYCTRDTWDTYYHEVVNGLHYLQDMQSEHHAIGNTICSPDNIIPTQTFNDSFQFARTRSCADFLDATIANASGTSPTIPCDDVVVTHSTVPGTPRGLSAEMLGMNTLCSLGLDLACMGMERTLRHHCELPDTTKTLVCEGEAGDHNPTTGLGRQYCEGESYPGTGEDYLALATEVSVPALAVAAVLWQAVCKEPDDPCDSDQCDTWCKHSVPPDDPSQEVSGFCLNADEDAACATHSCQCMSPARCGAHGDPCCAGDSCNAPGDVCSAGSGRCVASTTAAACPPPPPPPGTWGQSVGDPHFGTFDREHYDLQAVGELTLARDSTDGMEVQVRTRPWGTRPDVATNVAVAARVGSDVVAFYGDGTVRINHVVTSLPGGETHLHDGAIFRRGTTYTVIWSDNTQLWVSPRPQVTPVRVYVASDRRGHMQGLLGNFDGVADRTLVTRGGNVLVPPFSFATLYGTYAESWRIAQADSLFDYGPGETTETFTNRGFPYHRTSTRDLSDAERGVATAVCQAAHVPADWLDDCILDVGLTGDPRVAADLATSPAAGAPLDVVGGDPAQLDGATVSFSVRYPNLTTPISRTVSAAIGPGPEFVNTQNLALPGFFVIGTDIDVGSSTIDIRYRSGGTATGGTAFNGYVFAFSGPGTRPITGANIDPSSTPDLANVPVSFDATSVSINLVGRPVTATSRLVVNLLY